MLRELTSAGEPLTVIDTHGGAGVYDLTDDMATAVLEQARAELQPQRDTVVDFPGIRHAA